MKKLLSLLGVLGAGGFLLARPEAAAAAVREALALCSRTVIPSLFPFFVVTGLLLQLGLAQWLQGFFAPFMGPMFRMRGICALPLLTGLLGGYPSGARTAAELFRQGQLTQQEAELLLGFCDNCGPAFLLGYVGAGVLGDAHLGARLYLVHTAAALAVGMVLCRLVRDRGPGTAARRGEAREAAFPAALTAAAGSALGAVLNICAFVVVFRVLSAMLPEWAAWGLGALEMVSGTAALEPGRAGFIAAAAITGWGGLSVHCQALSQAPELRFRWHWAGKAAQAVLAAVLAAAVFPG